MAFGEPKFEANEPAPLRQPNEERKPEKKREAVILPFPQKGEEGIGAETGQGYEEYKTLGGALSQEQYQDVLSRVVDEQDVASSALVSAHAKGMAHLAGLTLSPETVALYGILRHEKPDQVSEDYHGMSDQRLLAEAFRINGEKDSLMVFIEKYPHIFH